MVVNVFEGEPNKNWRLKLCKGPELTYRTAERTDTDRQNFPLWAAILASLFPRANDWELAFQIWKSSLLTLTWHPWRQSLTVYTYTNLYGYHGITSRLRKLISEFIHWRECRIACQPLCTLRIRSQILLTILCGWYQNLSTLSVNNFRIMLNTCCLCISEDDCEI